MASADVTQPEQARQSVREIWAGGRSEGMGCSSLNDTSYSYILYSANVFADYEE